MIEQMFASENPRLPLFRMAFRAFFLFGAAFSAVALVVWVLTLNGRVSMDLHGGPVFWHIHEMLFGFSAAIIVGFLLTAVQTWTGVRSVNGWFLFCLFVCWAPARIGFAYDTGLSAIWLAAIDISFMLLAALFLSVPLLRVKQTRNLFFVPVLILFALCNGMMHMGLINQDHELIVKGTRSALLIIALLMVVIGGRVIPMFTANGTKTKRVPNIIMLDRAALACVWLIMLLYLTGAEALLSSALFGLLFVLAGVLHFVRFVRWRIWVAARVMLLWPLHLAYGFICLSFLLLGFDLINGGETSSNSWHLLTVGGIGLLVLAMISRVSLGHTGRPLSPSIWMNHAFVLMALGAVIRTFVPVMFPELLLVAINLSGVLWTVAYGTFAVVYFSMLTQQRIDKKPG